MLRYLISLIVLSPITLPAKDVYYLDVHSQGVAASVTLNGYRLWEVVNPAGQAYSSFVSPYLEKGDNELKIDFKVTESSSSELINPWIDCQIVKAPADHRRTKEAPGEVILKKRYEPEERRKISNLQSDDYQLLSGSTPKGGGLFYFDSPGERRWCFGIQLSEKAKFRFSLPRAVELTGLTDSLVLGEFHLRDSKRGDHLVYHHLKFLRGGEAVTLDPGNLSKGVGVKDGASFDTLWVFGFSAEGVSDLRVLDLKSFHSPAPVSESIKFKVELADTWQWQEAGEIIDLKVERESLISFLKSLHQIVDKESVEKWLPFFDAKISELSKAMGKPAGEMSKAQKKYFEDLRQVKSWGLEAFDESRLMFTPVNSRVLAVSYVDNDGPILSVPIVRSGRTEPDRFKIPLYLAKIQGEWTIVR